VAKLSKKTLEAAHGHGEESGSYISVGMSACGLAAGAEAVYRVFVEEVRKRSLPIEVNKCGCIGMCYAEPLVEVKVEGLPVVTYGKVNREVALRILEKHVAGKTLINDLIYGLKANE
jgi:NADP-reducing hydrogenase subunit HndB